MITERAICPQAEDKVNMKGSFCILNEILCRGYFFMNELYYNKSENFVENNQYD